MMLRGKIRSLLRNERFGRILGIAAILIALYNIIRN